MDGRMSALRSKPSTMASYIALTKSCLSLTCRYRAIGVTPSSVARRRRLTASKPSASPSSRARFTIAGRVRPRRLAWWVCCIGLDRVYGVDYDAAMSTAYADTDNILDSNQSRAARWQVLRSRSYLLLLAAQFA